MYRTGRTCEIDPLFATQMSILSHESAITASGNRDPPGRQTDRKTDRPVDQEDTQHTYCSLNQPAALFVRNQRAYYAPAWA